ncbi:MAG: galactose mutarotase [Prolixibacteraceae bacterium]|nr:galactose mutarotase [Prolixibacteraceae bacterium]
MSFKNMAGIKKENFEKTIDGKNVSLFNLVNDNGLEMNVTNYGAKVVSLHVPDKNGKFIDIVTGYNHINDYLKSNEIYFGAAIGRVGNRIAKGKFSLNSTEYKLALNNGPNHLHGGVKGFHAVVWDAVQSDKSTLELTYQAKDMEEGYPGNLQVKMVYKLTNNNEFSIEYFATTDKETICNLTHHSYFNLTGDGTDTILDHVLKLNADAFTASDDNLIPSGEIVPVEGTPLDFRKEEVIGSRIEDDFKALKQGMGYDHNFVLNIKPGEIGLAASVYSPLSGIKMEILTDQPGVQFYSGNWMDGTETGKTGHAYMKRSALCLETQHFPDSPNHPEFQGIELKPGETYRHTCIHRFSIVG